MACTMFVTVSLCGLFIHPQNYSISCFTNDVGCFSRSSVTYTLPGILKVAIFKFSSRSVQLAWWYMSFMLDTFDHPCIFIVHCLILIKVSSFLLSGPESQLAEKVNIQSQRLSSYSSYSWRKCPMGSLDSMPMAGSFPLIPESGHCISYQGKTLKILSLCRCCERLAI